MATGSPNARLRLRKHADYQRVYGVTRKMHARQMSFFFSLRPAVGPDGKPLRSLTAGPRIGLTVGKVLGKAHDRNRIKRRLRECIRRHQGLLPYPVDVVLHPRKTVLDMPAAQLDAEVLGIFRTVAAALRKQARAPVVQAEAGGPGPNSQLAQSSHLAQNSPPAQKSPAQRSPVPASPAQKSPVQGSPA